VWMMSSTWVDTSGGSCNDYSLNSDFMRNVYNCDFTGQVLTCLGRCSLPVLGHLHVTEPVISHSSELSVWALTL